MSDAGEVQSFQGGSVKPQRHGDHDDHHASFPSSERQNASGANALYKTDQPEQELAAGLPGATERKEGQGIQQHSEEGTADSTGAGSGFGGQQAGASKEALQGPQCAAPKERYEFEMKMDEAKGRLTGSKSFNVGRGDNKEQQQQEQQRSQPESRQQEQSSHDNGLLANMKKKLDKVVHHK